MVDGLPKMLTDRPVFMCSPLTSIILSEGRAVTDLGLELNNKLTAQTCGGGLYYGPRPLCEFNGSERGRIRIQNMSRDY